MKFLKKLLKILVLLLVLIVISVFVYSKINKPSYSGELEIKNLSENVTIYFDEIGVPHINAKNQKDAYLALGYVHAQDRLWQMEVIRRIAAGRLSEIFGEKLIRTDKLFSGLGIEEKAEETIKNLDKNSQSYQLAIAYLEGVNQFINEGKTPVEYTLVGVEKENFTIKDMYNVFGYMAFSFAIAHKTDPLLTEIKEKLGEAYFNEIIGFETENLTLIKNEKNPILTGGLAKAMNDIYDVLPIAPFIGSNSWVIGADKTKNGKVILANDPHIGYSQPSVWYQAHIKTPDYEMYGYHLALMPFPLLGHNRNYAYGLTMFENDDVDFYVEENHPLDKNKYRTPSGFVEYDLYDKRIKIKERKDSIYQIRVSNHGPLMNGIIEHLDDERPIAMQWIYTKEKNQILDVAFDISHATNLSEFKTGVSKLHAPGLNVMYGDVKDNIAWFAAGKLYKYRDSLYTKTFLNGASGDDEIIEYLDFKDNPQAINPKIDYVYSANNQPDSIVGKLYPGYYLSEDRAKRIVELLEPKNDWTKEEVGVMMNDVKSASAQEVSNHFVKNIDTKNFTSSQKQVMDFLDNWEGNFYKKEVGPVIYNRMIYEFQNNTFGDELGESITEFINTPFAEKTLLMQAKKEKSIWWDDITTKDKIEKKKDIVTKSFINAFKFLQNQLGENIEDWTWDRVITVEYKHSLGEVAALRKYFNVGPFITKGGDQVINNQIYNVDSTGYYKVKAGPSTRRVVDFSDVENSMSIVPTGQSGNVFSKHYKDQAKKYLNGEFVKMSLNETDIKKSDNILVLKPKK